METLIADKIRILSQDLQHLPMNSDRAKSLLNLLQKEKESTTLAPPQVDDNMGLQHLEITLKRFYLNKEFKYTISLLKNYLDRGELDCPDDNFDDCRYRKIRELVKQIVG